MNLDVIENLSNTDLEELFDDILTQEESLSWCACKTKYYSSISGCNLLPQNGSTTYGNCAAITGPVYNANYCINYCSALRCSVHDWYSGYWTESSVTCNYNRYS